MRARTSRFKARLTILVDVNLSRRWMMNHLASIHAIVSQITTYLYVDTVPTVRTPPDLILVYIKYMYLHVGMMQALACPRGGTKGTLIFKKTS